MTLIAFCDCGAQYGYPHFRGCKEKPEPAEYEPSADEVSAAYNSFSATGGTQVNQIRAALKAAHAIRTKRGP